MNVSAYDFLSVFFGNISYGLAFVASLYLVHCFFYDAVKPHFINNIITINLSAVFGIASNMLLRSSLPLKIVVTLIMLLIVFPAVVIYNKQYSLRTVLMGYAFVIPAAAVLIGINEMSLTMLFSDSYVRDDHIFFSITAILLFSLISLILYLQFVRRNYTIKFRKREELLVSVYLIFAALMYIFFIFGVDKDALIRNNTYRRLFWTVKLFYTALIVIFPVFVVKNRESAYFNDQRIKNEHFLEAELAASSLYREAQKETRAFRHDINNNLTAVAVLMKKKRYAEAEEYIDTLRGRIAALSPRIVTGDDMLDSLISSKLREMGKQHIRIRINGVIDGGLGWKPIDTCAVFANAVDNAVEACKKVPDITSRQIDISFRKTDYQRMIIISNSIAEKIDCTPLNNNVQYTSKDDKGSHGFGLRNMRRALEKYGAVMQMSCTDTRFTTTIIMKK